MTKATDEQTITNEEALRSLAVHYQRKASELEEGLVVANAKITKLEGTIDQLRIRLDDYDTDVPPTGGE